MPDGLRPRPNFLPLASGAVHAIFPEGTSGGNPVSALREVTEWKGMPPRTSRRLASPTSKPPSDGGQFIHSQQRTFSYQINPLSLYCMTENWPHLLTVGRQWVWEHLVGFPHRLNIPDLTRGAHVRGPATQPALTSDTEGPKPS